ncbi:MAG TPA: cytochrome c [Terracidiphilus sp.]|nr:cytochrome c [Terracidiphilus sp.]
MKIGSGIMLAALIVGSTAAVAIAQGSGAEIYKAKCASCHGADGMAGSGAGKALKVKPATDPSVKKMDEAAMIAAVRDGLGKMKAYKGSLTDAEIKASVDYFRTFVK